MASLALALPASTSTARGSVAVVATLSPHSRMKPTVEITVNVVVPESPFILLFRVGPVDCMSRTIKTAEAKNLQFLQNEVHLTWICSAQRAAFTYSDWLLILHGWKLHLQSLEANDLRQNLKDSTPTKHLSLNHAGQTAPISGTRSWFWFTQNNQSKMLHAQMPWQVRRDLACPKSTAPVQQWYLWAGTTLPPPRQLGRSHLESGFRKPPWIHANLPRRRE